MFRQLRNIFFGILIVLPIAGGIVGIKALQFKAMGAAMEAFVMPPEPVNSAEVIESDWQPRLSAVGTITAVQGAVVKAEAEGVVREINFEAGSVVKAGEVLLQLDTDIEMAQLREAMASAYLAEVSHKRAKELIASQSISQAEMDTAEANLKQANAKVDSIRALIAKKTVLAPFEGKLGIRQISVGQFMHKGDAVVSLHSLDPVFVEFSLPQQRMGELEDGLKVFVTSDANPEHIFEGQITAINPDIDYATRSVRIQATLANIDGHLRPGMFVTVDLMLARSERLLFIPATAVQHAPYGDSVFVITEGEAGADGSKPLVVEQQPVRLGERHGDYVAVREGVKAGDQIVSTGVFKLRPGMSVVIDNALAPEFSFTPKPKNT